jgi:DNA-binding transcriptional LysR family regulator
MIQLSHLRTLQAVVRCGSFSRAAKEVNLTQPAVSMQIRQLEAIAALPLLERVGKRVFPTKAGEILLGHANRAMHEVELALEALQQLRGVVAGRIRLGAGTTMGGYVLPRFFRRFQSRYPNAELILIVGNTPEIAGAVVNHDLDIGLVNLPVRRRELAVLPFVLDELVAIAPPKREWRGRTRITASELARQPLILYEPTSMMNRMIDNWFQREGVFPQVPMKVGNVETIKKLVEAGLGCSVISWISVKAEARPGKLAAFRLDPPLFRQIGIVHRKDKPKSLLFDTFLNSLKEFPGSLQTELM